MKSGYILAFCICLFGALDAWSEYLFFDHYRDYREYEWIMYINVIFLIPAIGLVLHKKWALRTFKIILWIWAMVIFWMGIVAADITGAKNIFMGMFGSIKLHWMQFAVFALLLYFISTEKVKRDFGIVVKNDEAEENK